MVRKINLPKKFTYPALALFLTCIVFFVAIMLTKPSDELREPSNQQQVGSPSQTTELRTEPPDATNSQPPTSDNESLRGDSDIPAVLITSFDPSGEAGNIRYSSAITGVAEGNKCILTAQSADGNTLSTTNTSTSKGCNGSILDSRITSGSSWTLTLTYKNKDTETASRKVVVIK